MQKPGSFIDQFREVVRGTPILDYRNVLAGKVEGCPMGYERAAASTLVIETMWKIVAAEKDSFRVEFSETGNCTSEVMVQVADFLRPRIVQAIEEVERDPEKMKIFFNLMISNHVALTRTESVEDYFMRNIFDGLSTFFALMELVFEFVKRTEKLDFLLNMETLEELAGGREMMKLAYMIGFNNSNAENAFLNAFTKAKLSVDGYGKRRVLAPDFVDMDVKGGKRVLKLCESSTNLFELDYGTRMIVSEGSFYGRCPAAQSEGQQKAVLVEFIEWMREVALKFLFPELLARGVKI